MVVTHITQRICKIRKYVCVAEVLQNATELFFLSQTQQKNPLFFLKAKSKLIVEHTQTTTLPGVHLLEGHE